MTPRSEARFDMLARRLASLLAGYTLAHQIPGGSNALKVLDEARDAIVSTLKECLAEYTAPEDE